MGYHDALFINLIWLVTFEFEDRNIRSTINQLGMDVETCQCVRFLHESVGTPFRKNFTELVSNEFLQFPHC